MNDPNPLDVTQDHQGNPIQKDEGSPSVSDPHSSAHGRFLPGANIGGRYRIVSLAGRGGMGEVYRADDLKLGHPVALKFLPRDVAEGSRRFQLFVSEVRLSRQVAHPNVCRVYDIGEVDGQHFLSMEYIDGEDLKGLLRRIGRLPRDKGLEIAQQLCAGLAAAHEKGVLHRDLKPANVMIDGRGQARITDFGLARLEDGASGVGEISGTPAYMAPEQLARGETTIQSDIYSLGLVLYEAFTGQPAHQSGSIAELNREHAASSPRPPAELVADVDPAVERAILHALQKDPRQRPASARALADALVARETPSPGSQSPGSPPRESPPQGKPSLAVLPFRNMSSDPENEFFSDGLAEELLTALSKLQGLRVASRTSSFAFRGKNEDVRRIGEALSVRTVLEGSVRKAENRLRISAQLINVADGYQVWSETYNRELQDVFAIQEEIAQSIAKTLQVILSEKEKRAIERAPTAHVEAYEYYLRGRQYFHQFRRKAYEFALQMFAHAIGIDPGYGLAHAGTADCHSLLYMYFDSNPDNLEKADLASRKALELAPDLAEAHLARGLALSLKKDYAQAEGEFQTAIRLDPKLYEARYFFGRTAWAQGKLADAAQQFEQAFQLRADAYQAASHLAGVYVGLGRNADAQAAFRAATTVASKHLEFHPDDTRALYLGATCWASLGERERALEWANRALSMDPDDALTIYNVASVYALLMETERAVDCLENALKHGFAHKEWIEHDSDLASIRSHPRYQALLHAAGYPG